MFDHITNDLFKLVVVVVVVVVDFYTKIMLTTKKMYTVDAIDKKKARRGKIPELCSTILLVPKRRFVLDM